MRSSPRGRSSRPRPRATEPRLDERLPGPNHWGRRFFGELYRASTLPHLDAERTEAEVRALARLLDLPAGGRVLDICCGHGRHAVPLASQHRVLGLDIDEASLALLGTAARQAGARLPCLRADIAELPLAPGALDGAFAWYSSLFLFDDATHVRILGAVRRALRPGGVFVHQSLDPRVLAGHPAAELERALPRGGRVRERSRFDPGSGRDEGVRRLELPDGRILEGRFSIRYPGAEELLEMAATAGFGTAQVLGGGPLGLRSEVCVLRAVA